MARTQSWLAKERSAMIGILTEMERNSAYSGGEASRGDLSLLLARLSQVAAGKNGRARSLSAMRQAWWRWTTDGLNASTPPVQELALMVRYANNNGWLRELTRPDCLSLVKRLMRELNERDVSEQRMREVSWEPTARIGVEGFVDFLEAQVVKRAAGDLQDILLPNALVIQQEARTMLMKVVERMLMSLNEPRELFQEPHESDSFLQPFEGWPEVFEEWAAELSDILTSAAKEYRDFEASLSPPPKDSADSPRRKNLLGAKNREPEES